MGPQTMGQGNMNIAARGYSIPANSNQNQYMQSAGAGSWGKSIYVYVFMCTLYIYLFYTCCVDHFSIYYLFERFISNQILG